MSVFEMAEYDGHEDVVFHHDPATNLRAIVAIHSTALGPAAGGCRMWCYPSSNEALTDVLRLSRGMSYKNAMAGLAFGGGKAVLIADPKRPKTAQLFEAYGRFVDSLGGRYITAEDVGTTTADMESVARQTRYVSGLARQAGDVGGDPGPKTALGVYLGLKAAAKFRLGRAELAGVTVAIQGVGGVGYHLARLLAADGARLLVADVRAAATERVADECGAMAVAVESIVAQEAEIFAPCALGAILNAQSIPQLRAKVVAGAANNQLALDRDGIALHAAGVLYAPDYVLNAGGIINVFHEYYGTSSEAQVSAAISLIPGRLTEIFERSRRENRPTNQVADELARARIAAGQRRLVA
ncbi:MAG TPA: Glu/Leu/Phe/Val dehydrogenase dimerization domain-containing protein [Steroidobacteraceae bacterium]